MPDGDADCPMAHMANKEKIKQIREQYTDVAVVCYVNSSAELKALSDVCVTSANALTIVKALPNENIFFIPDQNLARYIAEQLPEKRFIFNKGYCPVHHNITAEQIIQVKDEHPNAFILVHPECKPEVVALSDYAGSTSGIIKYASDSENDEFIIVTELGVMSELKQRNPHKQFYSVGDLMICEGMKKITLDKIIHVLETEESTIMMDEVLMKKAREPMIRMLELSNK